MCTKGPCMAMQDVDPCVQLDGQVTTWIRNGDLPSVTLQMYDNLFPTSESTRRLNHNLGLTSLLWICSRLQDRRHAGRMNDKSL